MAKINTTNYQPVMAWNGTQDLLVVEQPDGTKVATPEQVKQFMEAGDFEATGEIIDGHGNILAKKADITTVTIPRFIPSQAGWRRICKIKPTSGNTIDGMLYIGGEWSNGQPPSASVAINTMYSSASLTLLSSCVRASSIITDIRLVSPNSSGSIYWLDVYFPASSVSQGFFKLIFTGDIAVSDIQDPISITTDATAATAEVSLNQNVSGTVLTDSGNVHYTVSDITDLNESITINEFSLRKWGKIATLGINFNASSSIPAFTTLFKLPSGITGFGRTDATGVFTTKTLQAGLAITASGYVVSSTSINAALYYQGQITFICQ